jgi:hypothetical protein
MNDLVITDFCISEDAFLLTCKTKIDLSRGQYWFASVNMAKVNIGFAGQ